MFRDEATGRWMVDDGLMIREATLLEITRHEAMILDAQVLAQNPARPLSDARFSTATNRWATVIPQGDPIWLGSDGYVQWEQRPEPPPIPVFPDERAIEVDEVIEALRDSEPPYEEDTMTDKPIKYTKAQTVKMQETVKTYNKVFEEVITAMLYGVKGGLVTDFREAMYNCCYFMDDAFEMAFYSSKAKRKPNYTIWFKHCNKSYDIITTRIMHLRKQGIVKSIGGKYYIERKDGSLIQLKSQELLLSPEERIENFIASKHRRMWFEHQGSWYDILTGKYNIPHGLLSTRIQVRDYSNPSQAVVSAWLDITSKYENTYPDPHCLSIYIGALVTDAVKVAEDKIKDRIKRGREPFPNDINSAGQEATVPVDWSLDIVVEARPTVSTRPISVPSRRRFGQ